MRLGQEVEPGSKLVEVDAKGATLESDGVGEPLAGLSAEAADAATLSRTLLDYSNTVVGLMPTVSPSANTTARSVMTIPNSSQTWSPPMPNNSFTVTVIDVWPKIKLLIMRPINDSHPARTDLLENAVVSERLADEL